MYIKPKSRPFMNTQQLADYYGVSKRTIENSRYTGILFGVEAPPYKKMGKNVFYLIETADEWIMQFKDQTNTSQDVAEI